MGFVAWAVLIAAIIVVEALGLTLRGHEWPTLSDIFRVALRPEWSRWLLFAIWLWVGWHFFIRGWTFFLRGPGPRDPRNSLGGGKSFTQIVQQVIVPLTAFYAAFAVPILMAWRAQRRGDWPARPEPHAGARAAARMPGLFARRVLVTMVGGYVLFVAAMGVYEAIAGPAAAGIFPAAAREGAVLAFAIALPAFAALTAAEILIARRSRPAPSPPANLRP
jgi:Family of unknown function (DUF6186)